MSKLGIDPKKFGVSGDGAIAERAEETQENARKTAERAGETTENAGKTAERAEKVREWATAAIPPGVRQDARANMVSILVEIGADERITAEGLSIRTGLSDRGVWKNIASLRSLGLLDRIGPDKGGHWKLVGFEP